MLFGADQRDVALEASVAQPRRDRIAGRAGADDYRSRSSSLSLRKDQTRYPPSSATAKA
jgi:hypothetical protein